MPTLWALLLRAFLSNPSVDEYTRIDCTAESAVCDDAASGTDDWVQVDHPQCSVRATLGRDWVRVFDPVIPPHALREAIVYCDVLDVARCALVCCQWRTSLEPYLNETGLYSWEAVWASNKISSRPPPTLASPSGGCLDPLTARRLLQAHPKLRNVKTLYRIFDSENDGWSIQECLRLCDREGSCFLLVKEKGGAIFGAYIDSGILFHKPEMYGPSDSAVFQLLPEFKWWRARRPHWVVTRRDCLMMGGDIAPGQPRWAQTPQLPALGFDRTLQYGESYSSPGFGSPVLAPEVEFDAVLVEVWSFNLPKEKWGNDSQREANMGLLAAFGWGASAQGYSG